MKGTTYLLMCGIFLSFIAIFTKLLVPFMSPLLVACFRIGIAVFMIFIYLLFTGRLEELKVGARGLRIYIPVGLFGVMVGFGFYLKALDMIPVANAVFLAYIYPVIVAFLASKFLRERLGSHAVLSLIFAISGVWMIYGASTSFIIDFWGGLFALVSGFGYAIFIFSMKYMHEKGYKLWNTIFWPLVFGLIFLIPMALFAEPVKAYAIFPVPYYLLGIGFVSFMGYYLYAKGFESVKAHNAPVIVTLTEPTFAVIFAAFLLGEAPPEYILLGGLLIMVANLFVQLEERRTRLRKKA